MGAIDTSYTFTATDVITSEKMNNILDQSTITATAIIGTTLAVTTGKLSVAAGGIRANELAANAVTTTAILDANVTPAKLSNSDFGDFTVASGVVTIDAGVVTFAKIATAAVATIAEAKAETASKLVTADNVKHSPPSAKAYGSFTTATTARTLSGSYNTASVTRIDSANTEIAFTSPMASAQYTVLCQTTNSGATGSGIDGNPIAYAKTTTGFKISHVAESANRAVDFVVFGTLA
jgi:hypothetical protein